MALERRRPRLTIPPPDRAPRAALERRTLDGEAATPDERRLILDAMDSATNSLALGESNREEILIARRIPLVRESIRMFALMNDQRRYLGKAVSPFGSTPNRLVPTLSWPVS
ncbi:hypothetical protein [Thiocystis violacea]|uniref:hypothetical protein n=1 Tax=Thiocystis violacea TaxID=13725 RepID=UPI001908C070|nr:hypothetical protein [Thiocystis violacea]MBK1718849.1 hypothetical protein [Thiocystis violacea]